MRYLLRITVEPRIFEAYWYGYGTLVSHLRTGDINQYRYTVDYGGDRGRAQVQCDRFASGLYFGTVEEVAS